MSVREALFSLVEKIADGEAITLLAERCLNGRFRALNCSLCADTCPAESAIKIADGKPDLDNDFCLHCGLCVHRCPTDAFTSRDILSGKLVKLVEALPDGEVDLLCPQHPQPEQGNAGVAVQTGRCLAALSPVTLLTLSTATHPIWLDDSHCHDCPLAYVHLSIKETAGRSNEWIEILPDTPQIQLRSERREGPGEIKRRPVFDPSMSSVSRRSLFRSLREVGRQAAIPEEKAEMVRSGRNVLVSERLPQTLPRQHAQIISLVAQRTIDKSLLAAPAHFDISVDEARCTGCTLCAKFCPTGALHAAMDGANFDLTFEPSLCLGNDCSVCPQACPEDAINISTETAGHDLFCRSSLLAARLGDCRGCGYPICKGEHLPDTCFACRAEHDPTDTNASLDDLWNSLP